MEAIGSLAGGVAHDLNNLLASVVGYPDLVLRDLPPDSPVREPILTMKASGQKCAAIVNDLLNLARSGLPNPVLVDLNDVAAEFMSGPEMRSLSEHHPGVSVDCDLEPELPPVSGSPVHLSKVLLNLVLNGAEAMPDGGLVRIWTHRKRVDRAIRATTTIEPGDYVVLSVSDEGVGIPSDDVPRIFEPFYTRKEQGRSGTGLGMAIVWNTVKEHLGHIEVQSREGQGTSFTLYFPIASEKLAGTTAVEADGPPAGRGESVLVVDDEVAVRNLSAAMLESLGYTARTAGSAAEALEYLSRDRVDLVLLDMILGDGTDGLETYRRILDLHPGQRAVIISGFSESDRVRDALALGAGTYLCKPFSLQKLGEAVRGTLDR
jgi:CheY-like chemotaxis protein